VARAPLVGGDGCLDLRDVLAAAQLAAVNKAISRGGYAIVATGLEQCLTAEDSAGEVDAKMIEKLFLALA
jgi:DNA-binding FrmR family transcriptional regulator